MAAMVLFLCSLLCRVTQLAFFLFPQVSNLTVKSAKEGVERVRQSNGDFAFHSDSNTLEYHRILKKPCNLVEIGTFGGAFVGWGLQKHSKIKDVVDKAILHLYGSGEIERLSGGKENAPKMRRWRWRAALTMPPRPHLMPSFSVSWPRWPCYIWLLFDVVVERLYGFYRCVWLAS